MAEASEAARAIKRMERHEIERLKWAPSKFLSCNALYRREARGVYVPRGMSGGHDLGRDDGMSATSLR